jgi:methylphosphotriester-DNA--protein-cysteine methyltransferase
MKNRLGFVVLFSSFVLFVSAGLFAQESQVKASPSSYYVASKFSLKYHKPACRKALKIQEQNRITFGAAKEAIGAGFMPCPKCRPPAQD